MPWAAASGGRALAAIALGGFLLACGASAAAEPRDRPDLRPRAPSFSLSGDAISVSVTVRNRGDARARRTRLAVFLSADRRRGDGDSRIGRIRVRALGVGRRSAVQKTLRVPDAPGSRARWLIACADAGRRLRESSERNNCRASRRRVRLEPVAPGPLPPEFGGLVSATTCSPGPGGPGTSTPYRLRWEPATDESTPADAIVYDVYRASRSGGQDFDQPSHSSQPGATTFTTPPLSTERTWYFVVRARDADGNRDGNRVERVGEHLCG